MSAAPVTGGTTHQRAGLTGRRGRFSGLLRSLRRGKHGGHVHTSGGAIPSATAALLKKHTREVKVRAQLPEAILYQEKERDEVFQTF